MIIVDEKEWLSAFSVQAPIYIIAISSTDGGTVIAPGEGSFDYEAETIISLEAAPVIGYQFVAWTGDIDTIANPNSAQTTITMNGDYSITAVFEPIAVELGALKGHVYDKETKEPIVGVMVAFQASSTETDTDGYYEMPDLPIGINEFTFLKAGYQVAKRSATIYEGEWTTLDVELTPGEGPEPGFPWLWVGLGGAAAAVGIVIAKKRKPD
jgi:uncharacterized repeat protein (TIGR02543 family)